MMTSSVPVGKAPVWAYFIRDLNNPDKAVCQVALGGRPCGVTCYAKGNTTSTMLRHVENRHKEEFVEIQGKMKPKVTTAQKREAENPQNNQCPAFKQPMLNFGESDAALDKKISDAIVVFLADTQVAFRITGRPTFVNLMKAANKRIKLKSPQTYLIMVKLKAQEIVVCVQDIINTVREHRDIKLVAFTTYIWTSRVQDKNGGYEIKKFNQEPAFNKIIAEEHSVEEDLNQSDMFRDDDDDD